VTSKFEQEIGRRLTAIRDHGLYRELRRVDSPQGTRIQVAGRTLINFSSNDYLGLANHPALKEAAILAVEQYGAGSGAARLICGSLASHHDLEELLAAFKGTESALTFSSGYATAIGTITALLDKNDIIILDRLVHACIVDAARLSGARVRVFKHNDLNDLESILKWAASESTIRNPACSMLVVTESIFSMDGDAAPLAGMVTLKQEYGAWLMVDEAHATGLYGANRRGLAEELGVGSQIEIQMGTLGKALGASGGYICGSRQLIDFLVNRARSFIFSTAPVPAAAAAAAAAVKLVQSQVGEERRKLLWQHVSELRAKLALPESSPLSGIIPIHVGDETEAMKLAANLRHHGLFVPAVRYPTVARGAARLRVTLSAAHTHDEITQLLRAMEAAGCKLRTRN